MTNIPIEQLQVNPVFDQLLHTLHPDELETLKSSIEKEGVRDPIKIWGDVVIDGHNRLRIAQELGIPTVPVSTVFFDSDEDASIWILRNQIGRRNTSEAMRVVYIGELYNRMKDRTDRSTNVAQEIAGQEGISTRQVYRDAHIADAFQQASELLQNEYVTGDISAKDLIARVRNVQEPSREDQAQTHKDSFPDIVHMAAERVTKGINNLRILCADIDKIFQNQGEDLRRYAPAIADIHGALLREESEAKTLTTLVETPEEYLPILGTNYTTEASIEAQTEREYHVA